jgi:hypothetical protein
MNNCTKVLKNYHIFSEKIRKFRCEGKKLWILTTYVFSKNTNKLNIPANAPEIIDYCRSHGGIFANNTVCVITAGNV